MSSDRFRRLCITLFFLEDGIRGWTAVAGKLGDVSPAVIAGLKRQSQLECPSAIVLNSYFHFRQDNVLDGLQFLSKVCNEIDNHAAKRIVDEEILNQRDVSKVEQSQDSKVFLKYSFL